MQLWAKPHGILELLGLVVLSAGAPAGRVRAAVNEPDRFGEPPIHPALRNEATGPELVRAMLEAGGEAMLGVPGRSKKLPLHYTVYSSWPLAVLELLLARGRAGLAWEGRPLSSSPIGSRRPCCRNPPY